MRPRGVYPAIALAILCMSTASIMIRWCSAPPLIVAMYRVIFTAIIAVPLVRGSFIAGVKNISGRDLIYIAGAGFFLALGPGIAGHGIIIWALKYIKAPVVAVSILGESVGASILAFFIFGESLLWYQLAGGCLILSGIYTAAVNERSDCA